MARTSKQKNTERGSCDRQFHEGIYARLSVDAAKACGEKDGRRARKNESIETQIAIAKQYLSEHPEMELCECYLDLGTTGTNFKREGFERMMEDVKNKRIDCVIVKDLSRFGRDHIETGNYIQKIFPFLGVRFIALADGIDTFGSAAADELTVNLKNLVNELYARDIAQKVRAERRSRKEQGHYTGGIAPYGYRIQWVNGKRALAAACGPAEIVKDIFTLFLAGKNMRQIAGALFERGVQRPGVYRKTGRVYCRTGDALEQWTTPTLRFILTNPVYMGGMLPETPDGTQSNAAKRREPCGADCRMRCETHEPIVSADTFFRAADMLALSAAQYRQSPERVCKTATGENDRYAGLLFCGRCGRPMVRVAKAGRTATGEETCRYRYCCSAARRLDDLHCPAQSIARERVDELVIAALRREIALTDVRAERLIAEYQRAARTRRNRAGQKLARLGRQIEMGKRRGSELYLAYRTGNLPLDDFLRRRQENEQSLRQVSMAKAGWQRRVDDLKREEKERCKFLGDLAQCSGEAVLREEVLRVLIDRMEVCADHRVKIMFAFRGSDL